jgi:SM-20-related protein
MIEVKNRWESFVNGLAERGVAWSDDAFEASEITALIEVFEAWREADAFRKAEIGNLGSEQVDKNIRGDYIKWIEPDHARPATHDLLEKLHELRVYLNQTLYLGLRDLELHFAVYPTGTHYARHRDQFQGTSYRRVSMVLYLNTDWQPGDGGELFIVDAHENTLTIEPIAGRLVLFMSELEHEVFVTNRERKSLTGWMRDLPAGINFL